MKPKPKKKFAVNGRVIGGKYLGTYEAESAEKAIEMAEAEAYVSLCHHCADDVGDLEVDELEAREVKP
jgi:hypothetical protein